MNRVAPAVKANRIASQFQLRGHFSESCAQYALLEKKRLPELCSGSLVLGECYG